jgi:sec-independent protein translocase protein TatC
MTMFTLPVGLVFEMPVIMFFLAKIGIVSSEFLRKYRRHAVVIIVVLAAVITPPDAISQLIVAIPLYTLYEVSIIVTKRIDTERLEKERADEAKLNNP